MLHCVNALAHKRYVWSGIAPGSPNTYCMCRSISDNARTEQPTLCCTGCGRFANAQPNVSSKRRRCSFPHVDVSYATVNTFPKLRPCHPKNECSFKRFVFPKTECTYSIVECLCRVRNDIVDGDACVAGKCVAYSSNGRSLTTMSIEQTPYRLGVKVATVTAADVAASIARTISAPSTKAAR